MEQWVKRLTFSVSIISLSSSLVVHPQTLKPAYLAEMPAPARIIAEIKGNDAENTGERQMGAFMILVKMIEDMAYGLEHRFASQLTPDEQRIRLAYHTAYADVWHKVKDNWGKQYDGSYDHDRDLRNELLDKFFSANFKALYTTSNQNAAKNLQAVRDRMYGNISANNGSNQSGNNGSSQPQPPGGGPGTTGDMNRCIASGRSIRRCFTEVMGNGFSMFTGGMNLNEPIPVPSGLRMTGDYAAADGFRLIFEPEAVTMVCRGVPAPRPYSVEVTDTQALVKIQNGSRPVVLSFTPEGKLSGSGPISVTGQVPAGSHTEQTTGPTTQHTTRTRELTPLEAQQYPNATQNGQTYQIREDATEFVYGPTGTRTVTDFVTKTADCRLGLMSPIGGSPLPVINEISSNPFAMLTTIFSGTMTIFSGTMTLMKGGTAQDSLKEMLSPKAERAIAPGLRMHGRYAGASGFSLTFHPESVTLGCGDAERALEYSVQRSGNKTMLVANENGKPISFQLMPDGSVVGEGTVQVNGRVITGTTDDMDNPFTFAPRVARCDAGRLVAGGPAANVSTPANTTSAVPANSNSAPPSNTAPVVSPGGISLAMTSGPSVAGLLAGKPLVVLKDSLENVLAHAGLGNQGRSSRVSAWAHACEHSPRDQSCQAGAIALRNYYVAGAKLDTNGSATFANIPSTGIFYLVVDTSLTNRHLMWNVRVDLKPGANSIRLDESNTTPIDR